MALAHHDAAHGDERRGSETKLFGSQQGGDNDIAPGLQFAVGLHTNTAAQIIQQEDLLRLRQTKFPGNASVLDGTEWRRSGTAIVSADENHVSVRLGYARRYRAHSNLSDEFHGNARLWIDVF